MRGVCILLAVCCLLAMTGCRTEPAVSDPVSQPDLPAEDTADTLQSFSVAYSHDDTLNPYATTTEANLNLAGLLYDSLLVMDRAFVPQLSLAAAVDTPDATHLVASLRAGAVFSDGSAVTAQDVVTSFKQAKASPHYAALLENMVSASGDNKSGRITFTLAAPDVNSPGCLTFPVVKAATLTAEAGRAPVGGGAYVYTATDTGARLTANPHSGVTPHFSEVGLRHLPNSTAMYYALSSGDIAYYFDDLSGGTAPAVSGAHLSVPMNALMYVGVNANRTSLASPVVRQALSDLLDRPAVTTAVYSGRATPSRLPFHPLWQPVTQLELPSAVRDLDGAVGLLEEAGCKAKGDGTRLSLELIYCTDSSDRGRVAELLRTQWLGGGVAVTLVPLERPAYLQRLKKGEFDLYLGEIRLTEDMSLRPLLAGGDAGYGILRSGAAASSYAQYLLGEETLESFLGAFLADAPYIPLCWRDGFAAYDRRLSTVTPTGYDPYSGLAGWQ